MTDNKLPDYKNDPSEFDSTRKVEYPHAVELQMKTLSLKIRQARSVIDLERLHQAVQHSIIVSNMAAKMEMKRTINNRARELGFKGILWE